MAEVKQGSFNTKGYIDEDNTGAPYYCTFSWTLSSQDITNNTSTIKWSLVVKGGYYSNSYNTIRKYQVVVNGESKSSETSQTVYNDTVVVSGKTVIKHNNSNGKKQFTVSVQCAFEFSSYNSTGKGTWDLPSITRSATISSVKNVEIDQDCSVTWSATKGFKYKLRFTLGSWVYTTGFINPDRTGSYTYTGFNFDGLLEMKGTTLYEELSSAPSGSMTVILGTYNSSGTFISPNNQKTFTITVPSNVTPEILDKDEYGSPFKCEPQIYGLLVQNKNVLKITIDTTYYWPGMGSSMVSYKVSGPGITGTKVIQHSDASNLLSFNCGPFSNYGNLSYIVTAVDSRGRTSDPKTFTIYCHEYNQPKFTSLNIYRCAEDGTANQNSKYVKCNCGFTYSSVDDTNNVDVNISYKKQSSLEAYTKQNLISTNSLSLYDDILHDTNSQKVEFDINSTYEIYVTITDHYGGISSSQKILIFGQFRALNITKDGTGVALGKIAERSELFDCKWPAHFDTTVCLGNKVSYNDGNTGIYLNPEGYIHLQRDSSFEYGPYLRFNLDDHTNVSSGDIRVDPSNQYMTFSNSERYLFEAGKLYSGNCQLATNKVLWTNGTGAYYPIATHTLNLNEKISEQANGIVIIFSKYNSSTILDENFAVFFIPKQFVTEFGGKFVILNMNTSIYSNITSKVLYISDTNIKGHANNNKTGTDNGVSYNNTAYVIRRVIGV